VAPLTRLAPIASLLLLLPCAPLESQDGAPSEYAVKAAFLYNFARYVEWPAEAKPESGPFVITIVGQDPFDGVIDDALRGKSVAGRSVELRRVRRASEIAQSQIVFISSSEKSQLAQILEHLQGMPTLTVGEAENFAESGGIIRFRMERSRVRLDVNTGAAQRARLRISSELLKLARIVGDGA